MEEKTVHVPSISCGHCVMTIKREVAGLEGVMVVEGDEKTKTITIKWDAPATWEGISAALRDAGHPVD